MKQLYVLAVTILFFSACGNPDVNVNVDSPSGEAAPALIGYSLMNSYPHDTSFFTEGFEFHDGQLYEASGSGASASDDAPAYPSAFGAVNLKTGKVDQKAVLDNRKFFGEGITFFNGKVYQLTWQTHVGYVYDAKTFKKLQEFTFPGEGWALTHDSAHIIMSDGSSNLQFIDPNTINGQLRPVKIVGVSDNNGPVSNINELEYVNGFIYANQYLTNYILKIDPSNGKVLGKIDLTKLTEEAKTKSGEAKEMNGVALNPQTNSFFLLLEKIG